MTVCPFCSCGCCMYPQKSANGSLAGLVPLRNHPISMGSLCMRGWNSHEFTLSRERISSPLIMKNGQQVESSWDEAIKVVSSQLKKIKAKWGAQSIAFIGSTRCSNEDNYLLMKLARTVVKTNHLDTSNRLTYFPVLDGFYDSLGVGASTTTLDQIIKSDLILVVGSDLSGSSPQVASRVFEALNHQAELIVVDPRLTKIAKLAHHHLQIYPGKDLYWINGMISYLVKEKKLDADFLNRKTTGFNELKKGIADFSFNNAEEKMGISYDLLKSIAERLVEAKTTIIIGSGITNALDIKKTTQALVNLALITANIGEDGTGILLVGGDNNTQGAYDMGVVPDRSLIDSPSVISDDTDSKQESGRTASILGKDYLGILSGVLSGEIRALYVMGENILPYNDLSNPLVKALSNLELLVVQELFPSEFSKLATVVFPASTSFERGGTFTNLERRVQRFEPVIAPAQNTSGSTAGNKPDWEIIASVARSLGANFNYQNVFDVTDEYASTIPFYEGIDSTTLAKNMNGIIWLENINGERGEPWLQEEWKGKLIPVFPEQKERIEIDPEYPLLLIPGRFASFWGSGTRSSRIKSLAREEIRSAIHLNPQDAKKLGLKEGWRVRVVSGSGNLETSLKISEDLQPGLAYLPIHKVDGSLPRLYKSFPIPIRVESISL